MRTLLLLLLLGVAPAPAASPGPLTAEELGRFGTEYEKWWTYHDIEELRWLLSHQPDEFGFERLSDLYIEAERYEMAIRAADESLQIEPRHWPSHLNKSTALFRLGEKSMAEKEAQKARLLAPSRDEPVVNLALIRWDQEDRAAARKLFETAIGRHPRASWRSWVVRQLARLEEEMRETKLWEKAR